MRELAEAQTFPFYRVYWVGPASAPTAWWPPTAARTTAASSGDSVYYGNCLPGKTSALDGGGCELPLRVTTLIYTRQANASLGAQRNTILRGVPAVIYNGGNTVELYSGRVAIEVFSDDLSEALRAIRELRPINAPGGAGGALPPPVYCPGLSGPRPAPCGRRCATCRGTPASRSPPR